MQRSRHPIELKIPYWADIHQCLGLSTAKYQYQHKWKSSIVLIALVMKIYQKRLILKQEQTHLCLPLHLCLGKLGHQSGSMKAQRQLPRRCEEGFAKDPGATDSPLSLASYPPQIDPSNHWIPNCWRVRSFRGLEKGGETSQENSGRGNAPPPRSRKGNARHHCPR